MIKAKKLALAAVAILATALTFTGCESFGKDDFFGTWETTYTVTRENFLDANKPGADDSARPSDAIGSTVNMEIYFDGTTESLFNKNGKRFYQYRVRKVGNEVKSTTFWVGTYDLKNNENYTNGDLVLTYMYGWSGIDSKDAEKIASLWTSDKCKEEEDIIEIFTNGTTVNGKTYKAKYDYHSNTNKDVETFSFVLDAPSFTKGYTEMTATAKQNCSWEVKTRKFTLKESGLSFLSSTGGNSDRAAVMTDDRYIPGVDSGYYEK